MTEFPTFVNDGRECLGHITGQPPKVKATGADGKTLGVFRSCREAMEAILAQREQGVRP